MAITANGWPQLTRFPARFTAPNGNSCPVASTDLAILFAYVGWRMDTEVAHLTTAYGGRTIAEQIEIYRQQGITNPDLSSNHISGTACDFAKPGVVYERFQKGTYRSGYTAAQEQRIREICTATGVMQWGGDFHVGFRDPVHIQVRENLSAHGQRVITAAQVTAAAKKVGAWVQGVQKVVGVTADGIPGPGTIQAVKDWQTTKHLVSDGIWGPVSQAVAGQTTPPAPPNPTTTQLTGVDVSSYQTITQWQAQRPEFVIAKAHEGLSWHDPAYQGHRAAARAAGILFGAYTYAWPEYDPVACCTDFLATAGLRTGEVGVMDFEPYRSTSNPATWPGWLIRFGTEYRRRTGVWPWLYADDNMLTRVAQYATVAQMNLLRSWPLWKAAYAATAGDLHGWAGLTCWQHTDKPMDLDVFYGDATAFRRTGIGGTAITPPTAPITPTSKDGDDMPDTAPEHSWSGTRPLKKGWNPVQIDTLAGGNAQYTCESGPATGTSDLYVAVDGLTPGQTIQIRAVEYAQIKGKWTVAKSYGVSEHQTTDGATFAHRTQVIKVPAGRRLSWEINVPADCQQTAGTTRDLIWKKAIS